MYIECYQFFNQKLKDVEVPQLQKSAENLSEIQKDHKDLRLWIPDFRKCKGHNIPFLVT